MAREAGALLLERFGGPRRDVDVKSSATDMVSAADRDAEALIAACCARSGPTTGCWPRRAARARPTSGRRWVVDPLDGTTNFLYGFPAWAVSIALEDDAGALWASCSTRCARSCSRPRAAAGATLNGEPLSMSTPRRAATALVATGFGYDAERRGKQGAGRSRACCRASATSGARGRRRWTCAGSRRGAWTPTTSAGWAVGLGRGAARRRGGRRRGGRPGARAARAGRGASVAAARRCWSCCATPKPASSYLTVSVPFMPACFVAGHRAVEGVLAGLQVTVNGRGAALRDHLARAR